MTQSKNQKTRRVVFNQKGGVGKSSIVANLAAISASKGRKTLVIDLDVQGNATQYLLGRERAASVNGAGIDHFFKKLLSYRLDSTGLENFVQETAFPNLSIVPAGAGLSELHAQLEAKHKIYNLRRAVDALEDFDAVFIDTPPAFNFYSLSALIAAQSCLIPFDCDDFSRQAIYRLMENIKEAAFDHNQDLEVEGIVINHFQPRANFPARIVAELEEEGLPVLGTFLSSSVKMRESHAASKPMIHFAPAHKLSHEFLALYEELYDTKAGNKRPK